MVHRVTRRVRRRDVRRGRFTTRDLNRYRSFLIVDCGMGKVCADGYCRCMRAAVQRMGGLKPYPAAIRKQVLAMREVGYSYSHVVNTSLAFEHWCRMRGQELRLGRPRKPKHVVAGLLSEAEVSRIIQASRDTRQKALLAVLAFSGLRNQELCAIKVEDVDAGRNTIRVRGGKGVKDRIVNIAPECTEAIIDYLGDFAREGRDHLFATKRAATPLRPQDIRKIVRTAAVRARLGKRVYPHLLRHSLATNLLARGASLMLIKEQLGHAFIGSTMIYVGSVPVRMRSEYDFYKPAYL